MQLSPPPLIQHCPPITVPVLHCCTVRAGIELNGAFPLVFPLVFPLLFPLLFLAFVFHSSIALPILSGVAEALTLLADTA